nr:hypothetical protein [uncultured Cohaesibacter sp.]
MKFGEGIDIPTASPHKSLYNNEIDNRRSILTNPLNRLSPLRNRQQISQHCLCSTMNGLPSLSKGDEAIVVCRSSAGWAFYMQEESLDQRGIASFKGALSTQKSRAESPAFIILSFKRSAF